MERINAIPVLAIDNSSLWVQTKDVDWNILYEYLQVDTEGTRDSDGQYTEPNYTVLVIASSREFPRPPLSNEAQNVIHDMKERYLKHFRSFP